MTEDFKIRNATLAELIEVLRVEEEAWPPEIRAPSEKFQSRLKVFPEGFFAAYVDGKMAAVSTSQIIDYPNTDLTSWEKITDNGLIRGSHSPQGNALYVVSLGVSSYYQGRGLGSKLLEAQKELVKRLNLKFLVLGSRIPEFHKHNMKIEDYLKLTKENGETLDSEIRFYQRCGLEVAEIVPNYMEDDPESRNYGAVMVWENKG